MKLQSLISFSKANVICNLSFFSVYFIWSRREKINLKYKAIIVSNYSYLNLLRRL